MTESIERQPEAARNRREDPKGERDPREAGEGEEGENGEEESAGGHQCWWVLLLVSEERMSCLNGSVLFQMMIKRVLWTTSWRLWRQALPSMWIARGKKGGNVPRGPMEVRRNLKGNGRIRKISPLKALPWHVTLIDEVLMTLDSWMEGNYYWPSSFVLICHQSFFCSVDLDELMLWTPQLTL